MSSDSFDQLIAAAKRNLSEHVAFRRKVIANELNLRDKDVRLTYAEMWRAGQSAARAEVPWAEDKLMRLLVNNQDVLSYVVRERGSLSVKSTIHHAFIELATLKMRPDVVKLHEDQFDGFGCDDLLKRARSVLDVLHQTGFQNRSDAYAETYEDALILFETKGDEGALRQLAQLSIAYIDRLKYVRKPELARRVEEEMDFVLGKTERFLMPALALEPVH